MKAIKLGILGAGRVVQVFHLPVLQSEPHWNLKYLSDPNPARRQWAEQNTDGLQIFSDTKELLEQVDLEAVLIASPPDLHSPLALQALGRGSAVLLEKPGGLTLQQAQAMSNLADQSGRTLSVAYNRRFMPAYCKLRRRVRSLGTDNVRSVAGTMAFSLEQWSTASGYLGNPTRGGGVLHDVVCHWVDTIGWLFDDAIVAVKVDDWRRQSGAEEQVRFDLRLASGLEIQLKAAHGASYREELIIKQAGQLNFLYPMGVMNLPERLAPWVHSLSKHRYRLERKLTRLGLLKDPMLAASRGLWKAFYNEVRGQSASPPLVDGSRLISIHKVLEKLSGSRDQIGQWKSIG